MASSEKRLAPHLEKGTQFEKKAREWVRSRGGSICEENFRCKGGEIDLIYEEQTADGAIELVFTEVRYRGKNSYLRSYESVDSKKRQRLMRAIQAYLSKYSGPAQSIRVDILGWDHKTDTDFSCMTNAWVDFH